MNGQKIEYFSCFFWSVSSALTIYLSRLDVCAVASSNGQLVFFISHFWICDVSLVSDARQQDFPLDDQQCASYRQLLLCSRLRPDPQSAAPGQHQPWVSGDESSGEGKIYHTCTNRKFKTKSLEICLNTPWYLYFHSFTLKILLPCYKPHIKNFQLLQKSSILKP